MSKSVKKNTMPKAPWPHNRLMAAPYLLWSAAFIIIPLCMIFYYGLTDRSGAFTFENVTAISSPEHMKALITALVLSLISTVVCLALAYPLAMILAGRHVSQQSFIVLIFLEKTGVINSVLSFFGLPTLNIINTPGAIILGMVYNFLPFMVLPLYNALTKIDPNVINAAHDLGANWFQTFLRVIFPLSLPGVISGITMVFVPALTTFVISNLLGGSKILLIGNVIEQEFTQASNWHLGSGLSIVLMVFILINMLMTAIFDKNGEGTSL